MRVTRSRNVFLRLSRDERGATAVIFAIVIVLLVALMALVMDGGLLWVKHRRVANANDAAALAAALKCATTGSQGSADSDANATATANVAGATPYSANVYTPNCNKTAGTVRVRYGSTQELVFGPAVGVASPKTVVATATAAWGAAGGADQVVPLMISFRNTDCNIPNGTPPQTCHFWFDDDFAGLSTFGVINLSSWGISTTGSCPPGASGADLNTAIDNGWPSPLLLNTNPTYVCGLNGSSVHANIASHINHILPHQFMFPVNKPSLQVPPCADTATTCAEPTKYAIIGFAQMTITKSIVNNNQAKTLCAGVSSPGSGGNYRCIEAVWTGWNTDGYIPGGGSNFGTIAVQLKQ
jgi:Flp pilus assembly protein TadG